MATISSKDLLDLLQSRETWYFAVRPLRIWIRREGEEPKRPYLTITASAQTGIVRSYTVGEKPTLNQIEQSLFKGMAQPLEELNIEPQRPARIFFDDRDLHKTIAPALQDIGVETKYRGRSEIIDELVAELEEDMRGGVPEIPGLLSQRKVSPKIVSEFFTAAANYYRAAPWVQLSNDDLLAVRVGDQKEPYFVTVMGQGGVEYGLALYLDWEQVLQMFSPHDHPLEVISTKGTHSLLFEGITVVPFDDLEAIERYNWEVASKQAYPVPLVFLSSDEVKRPDLDGLLWYTVALQAIPKFVEEHLVRDDLGDIQPVRARYTISRATRTLPVEVVFPAGDLSQVREPIQTYNLGMEPFDDEVFMPFDRRAMEGDFMETIGMLSESPLPPDVGKAQDLMYQAWEEPNQAQRLALAYKALKISADCADAYVLLAEEQADTVERALSYYQQGVEAGRRALGETYFEENEGHFWGLLETRPFMRAMEGMAKSLWRIGQKEKSLWTYKEMLRLNPGDNQGIRYILVELLQAVNRYDELAALIEEYPDDWSAVWLYTRALMAFREGGASEEANQALSEAFEQNQHVPPYLTGEKRVPMHLPDYIGWGDESEAANFAADHLNNWRRTPGAVQWLQDKMAAVKARKQSLRDQTGFKLGDSVKVKEGISDPDFGMDLSGWQGRIKEIDVDTEPDPPMLLIEWDRQTLEETPDEAIELSEEEGLDWTKMNLPVDEVIPAEPRDDPQDRHEIIWRLSQRFAYSHLGEQGKRIQGVLEGVSFGDVQAQYKAWEEYLQGRLTFPFEAEITEHQESGPLQIEDRVEILEIKGVDDLYGVLVQIRKKGYGGVLPLYDLEVDEDLPQFQMVDDYLTWFINR